MADEWTIAKVEEALWGFRAAGGTDDTPLEGIFEIRAQNLVYTSDVVRASKPEPGLPRWLVLACQTTGVLIAVPLVVAAVVWAWAVLLGVLF